MRIAAVVALALLLAAIAIRSAAVQSFVERKPAIAATIWPDHPEVSFQRALADIGQAAAAGRPPDPATLAEVQRTLRRAPLSAQPFLVEGTRALSSGELTRADILLSEAARRDPRLPAARFLLADLYLQQGRTSEGLGEIAALIRRLPKAAGPLTPSIVQFAKQPGAAARVRSILARNPQLRGNVLSALADDPANAELVLALAEGGRTGALADWQSRLVTGLVRAGDYKAAYRLWTRFTGVPAAPRPGLFNARFDTMNPPPPFNWQLANGSAGVAEPAAGGGLHLLYYGREEAVLAAQVLLLTPGKYRLGYSANGPGAGLAWSAICLPSKAIIGRQDLGSGDLVLSVPPTGCAAQELQLSGSPSESGDTVEATIRNISLVREGR